MKKKILVSLCVCITYWFSMASFAGAADVNSSQASTTTGGTVTIGTSTSPGSLVYNPSPSVLMAVAVSPTAYAIKATNSLTDTTNGMEYGTTSAATGYAQRTKTVAAATAVPEPTDENTLDGTASDWTWMGGNGS